MAEGRCIPITSKSNATQKANSFQDITSRFGFLLVGKPTATREAYLSLNSQI
jgi:hypothetical protein